MGKKSVKTLKNYYIRKIKQNKKRFAGLASISHGIFSVPIDWMDGVDTPGILKIPTAKNLLVSDLETEEAMKIYNVC